MTVQLISTTHRKGKGRHALAQGKGERGHSTASYAEAKATVHCLMHQNHSELSESENETNLVELLMPTALHRGRCFPNKQKSPRIPPYGQPFKGRHVRSIVSKGLQPCQHKIVINFRNLKYVRPR